MPRSLPFEDVAAQAAPFEDAAPLGERIAAQDVGRAVGRNADVGQSGQVERALAGRVGLLSALLEQRVAASSRMAWTVR